MSAGGGGGSVLVVPGRDGALSVRIEGGAGGADAVPLVVVNGGPGLTADYLRGSAPFGAFARTRPVIFYDQRGLGGSRPLDPGAGQGLDDHVADLEAIRAHLGFARIALLGDSFGGLLAMAYAVAHGARVARLVLSCSVPAVGGTWEGLLGSFYPDIADESARTQALLAGDEEAAAQADIRDHCRMIFHSPRVRDAYLAALGPVSYDRTVAERVWRAVEGYDLSAGVAALACPTLVLAGRHDANVPPIVAWTLARAIPGARLAIFEESGHLPAVEQPDLYRATVTAFLDAPAGGDGPHDPGGITAMDDIATVRTQLPAIRVEPAAPAPRLARHADTFLSLTETAIERRFEMPYRATHGFEGAFIDARHEEIGRTTLPSGMIDYGVDGWLLPADALKLYEMAWWCEGDILELGAYRGLSAAIMNEACNHRGRATKIISIDLDPTAVALSRETLEARPGGRRAYFFQDDAGTAVRNLAGVKRQFGFAFVDHSHRYEHVLDACRDLHRVVAVGGFALFHDFNDPRNGAEDAHDYGVYQGVVDGLKAGRWEFWGIYGCSGLFRHADPRRAFL